MKPESSINFKKFQQNQQKQDEGKLPRKRTVVYNSSRNVNESQTAPNSKPPSALSNHQQRPSSNMPPMSPKVLANNVPIVTEIRSKHNNTVGNLSTQNETAKPFSKRSDSVDVSRTSGIGRGNARVSTGNKRLGDPKQSRRSVQH